MLCQSSVRFISNKIYSTVALVSWGPSYQATRGHPHNEPQSYGTLINSLVSVRIMGSQIPFFLGSRCESQETRLCKTSKQNHFLHMPTGSVCPYRGCACPVSVLACRSCRDVDYPWKHEEQIMDKLSSEFVIWIPTPEMRLGESLASPKKKGFLRCDISLNRVFSNRAKAIIITRVRAWKRFNRSVENLNINFCAIISILVTGILPRSTWRPRWTVILFQKPRQSASTPI